ncbi:hypothetical protein B0T21DRAFT_396382 [Apiosordaria backusii]|uniref:Rhodopsin domain-containing protein n=1 Tax=Apiosordaria backusii TaxID=314023 RepID=A0AA40DV62_9PEZI|nr:hypothetical protein B0T21DRAFT_396382 [Apiosordaria backusii]
MGCSERPGLKDHDWAFPAFLSQVRGNTALPWPICEWTDLESLGGRESAEEGRQILLLTLKTIYNPRVQMEDPVRKFLLELWSLQGTTYLIVALRYVSRVRTVGWGGLSWDDIIMALATMVYTGESVAAHLIVTTTDGLANNGMTDKERAALDPDSEEYAKRVMGSKYHVAGLLLYATLLWSLKACWTLYYSRLTAGVHRMRRIIQVAYVLVPATYIICLLVAFLKCIPFEKQWQIYPPPSNGCQPAISTLQTIVVMVLHLVTVLFLMAIPLPMVWKANLPLRKKLMLFIMFSGGFLEMAFSILRCTSILMLGNTDPAQSAYWSLRESFVSVTLTNMPMVYPLVKHFFEKGLSSRGGGKSGTNNAGSNGYPLGTNAKSRTNNSRHPLSIPDNTCWGSEENIVENGADAKTTATASISDESPSPLPRQGRKSDGSDSEKRPQTGAAGYMSAAANSGYNNNAHRGEVWVGKGRPLPPGHDVSGIVVTAEYTVTEHVGTWSRMTPESGNCRGKKFPDAVIASSALQYLLSFDGKIGKVDTHENYRPEMTATTFKKSYKTSKYDVYFSK